MLKNFELRHTDLGNPLLAVKLQPFFTSESRKYIHDLYDSFITDVEDNSEHSDSEGHHEKERNKMGGKELNFKKLKVNYIKRDFKKSQG